MFFGPDYVRGDPRTPCYPRYEDGRGGVTFQQTDASLGSPINISFGGVPPMDVYRQIYEWPTVGCGPNVTSLTLTNQSWFMWDVQPFKDDNGDPREYGVEGQAIMFLALERNGTDEQRVFNSANYTITAANSGSSASRVSVDQRSILKGAAVAALLLLPAIFSL